VSGSARGSGAAGGCAAGLGDSAGEVTALLRPQQIERAVAQIQAQRPGVTREELTAGLTELNSLCASHALFSMWNRGGLELGFDGSALITRVTSPRRPARRGRSVEPGRPHAPGAADG
jgi:hypothetical protein